MSVTNASRNGSVHPRDLISTYPDSDFEIFEFEARRPCEDFKLHPVQMFITRNLFGGAITAQTAPNLIDASSVTLIFQA